MSLEILRNPSAKSKLTCGFETCQESGAHAATQAAALLSSRALAACSGSSGWPIVFCAGFAGRTPGRRCAAARPKDHYANHRSMFAVRPDRRKVQVRALLLLLP